MSLKFVVKKVILPKNVPRKGVEGTEPTLENVIKSVLSYCNAFPMLCEIKEVSDDYESKNELVFYFDTEKYRFFDVVSPSMVFFGEKYGDEMKVNNMYLARVIRSMVTLLKAEDLLKLMGIEVEYMKSFVEQMYEKVKGEEVE
ncbi:MAG: hypothetical protein L7H07_02850 [Candidatus Nanopusillus sp.]|nr:hypothetical protein [Candidatus Nanopusillus sp.]